MSIEELKSKRAMDLTGGELAEIVLSMLLPEIEKDRPKTIVRGIQGIADALNIGKNTALRILHKGVIDEAVTRDGNIILTDVKRAIELYKEYNCLKKKGFKV